MGFVVFFLVTWLAVVTFYSMPKGLSFMENTVVLLIALAVSINVSWIIIEELNFIKLTKDPLLYAGYLLYRSLVEPFIYVIWLNLIYSKKSNELFFLATVGCAGSILGLNWLALYYHIYTYITWNAFYDFLVVVSVQSIMFLIYKLVAKWMYMEVKHS